MLALLLGHPAIMSADIQHKLGKNISSIRRSLHLNKVDFSLQLGISRVELDLIESGRSNVKLVTLAKLAERLGKEPWELLK